MKSDRTDRAVKEISRKENIGPEIMQRNTTTKEEECEDMLVTPFEEQQPFKLVKINVNKLVPLSIDRLRERIKML